MDNERTNLAAREIMVPDFEFGRRKAFFPRGSRECFTLISGTAACALRRRRRNLWGTEYRPIDARLLRHDRCSSIWLAAALSHFPHSYRLIQIPCSGGYRLLRRL